MYVECSLQVQRSEIVRRGELDFVVGETKQESRCVSFVTSRSLEETEGMGKQ